MLKMYVCDVHETHAHFHGHQENYMVSTACLFWKSYDFDFTSTKSRPAACILLWKELKFVLSPLTFYHKAVVDNWNAALYELKSLVFFLPGVVTPATQADICKMNK